MSNRLQSLWHHADVLCSTALVLFLAGGCVPTGAPAYATSAPPPVVTSVPTATSEPLPTTAPTETPEPTPWATKDLVRPEGCTEALVTRVVDGDTIHVDVDGVDYTVRYIGIDTPETVHPNKPVEWMGPEASAANKALVEDQTVWLETDVSETDRYGRLLRYVWVGDTMVNAELVRQGYAQVSTYPPDVHYVELFMDCQREAREQELGLWQ